MGLKKDGDLDHSEDEEEEVELYIAFELTFINSG